MTDDYTPTTEEVREAAGPYGSVAIERDAFDAWLAANNAKVWQEGALWAAVEIGTISHADARWLTPGDNPYRETETP